jgi:hypothetical protein
MNEREARETIYELVEAERDVNDARAQLERFNAANTPPRPPDAFDGLDEFTDFYRIKRKYEDTLASLEGELEGARTRYEAAKDVLQTIWPENVPLSFIYEGRRSDLEGVAYRIVNRRMGSQTQIVLTSDTVSE